MTHAHESKTKDFTVPRRPLYHPTKFQVFTSSSLGGVHYYTDRSKYRPKLKHIPLLFSISLLSKSKTSIYMYLCCCSVPVLFEEKCNFYFAIKSISVE